METIEQKDSYKTSEQTFKEDTIMLKLVGVPLYLFCLGLFSKITMELTGTIFLTTPVSWMCDMIIFYLWHVHAHYKLDFIPFNDVAHRVHNEHHYVNFPPGFFWGSPSESGLAWRKQSQSPWSVIQESLLLQGSGIVESFGNQFYAIVLYLILTLTKRFFCGFSWGTIWMTSVQSFLIMFLGNYLHKSFHIKSHWLEQFKLWRELRYLHYLHHCGDTKHNYSIFAFVFDKIFGTYKNKKAIKKD